MATITIDVEDNQTELDAIKQQFTDAGTALTTAIEQAQAAAAALQAFAISFSVSIPPSA